MRSCSICGTLVELMEGSRTCSYCGQAEEGDHACANGHYTCQACRSAVPSELVARVCENSLETDPIALADLIISHPVFNQMGPQYHVVTGPVLVTMLANIGKIPDKRKVIAEAIERSKNVPALSCAQRGVCGAAVGAGVAVAMLTNAGPLTAKERSLAMKATSSALERIATQSGVRCCRQSVYAAIEAAVQILNAEMGIKLPIMSARCRYADRTTECKHNGCPYHGT